MRLARGFVAAFLCILMVLAANIVGVFAEPTPPENPLQNYFVLRAGPGWADDLEQNAGSRPGAELRTGSEYDINFAYGHRFLHWLRVEFELGYLNLDVDQLYLRNRNQIISSTGTNTQFRGMLNVFAEWNNTTAFTPFIGGGIGLARNKLDLTYMHPGTGTWRSTKNTHYPFAYQFLVGAAWAFHPSWQLELLSRIYGSNDTKQDNPGGTFPEHNIEGVRATFIELGLRYNF